MASRMSRSTFRARATTCATPSRTREYAGRNAANIVWLQETFARARRNGSAAVMIIAQADPGFDLSDATRALARSEDAGRNRRCSRRLQGLPAGAADEVIAFGKPVAYVHGDSHYFRIDRPFLDAQGRRLENFTRVETFGDHQENGINDVHWVKATGRPATAARCSPSRRSCDESQEHGDDRHCCGLARRRGRPGHFRAGQVHGESAGRARVLRVQGIRSMAGHLPQPERKGGGGDPRQSRDDRRLPGRHSRQRQACPGRGQDGQDPLDAETERVLPGCDGAGQAAKRGLHGEGQQEIRGQRRMGIRRVRLRRRVRYVQARHDGGHAAAGKRRQVRVRLPHESEGERLRVHGVYPPPPTCWYLLRTTLRGSTSTGTTTL